jgi:uncharacterized protein (UPF0335 family)
MRGHVDPEESMSGPGGVAGDQLRAFVERIEQVDEEIKALTEDKKDIYAEAKGQGFDVKILREVIRIRKKDQKERDEEESLLDSTFRHWRPPRHQSRRRRDHGRLRPPFLFASSPQ